MKLNQSMTRLSALVLIGSLTLSACGGKEERKAKHMEKGKAYLEQSDYDKARVEFKNVLQIDPKSAEGYYMTGLLEEKQQNWQKAFAYFNKALELNPQYLQAKAKLAKFYLLSGHVANAQSLTN